MSALLPEMERILSVAESVYGTGEVPPGSNRGPCEMFLPAWKVEEYKRRDKEAGKLVHGDPWCAFSACWVLHKALDRHPLQRQIGGVHALALQARKLNLYIDLTPGTLDADMGFLVYPGCLFVMLDRPLDAGASQGHTGIVTGVANAGDVFSTAEGNTGNKFGSGRRTLRDARMRGIVLSLGHEPLSGDWPRGLRSTADLSALGTR